MRSDQAHIWDFYSRPRLDLESGKMRTLYEVWEAAGARQDSVTPSTYCSDYRSHIVALVTKYLGASGSVFSIGCGNAFVERDLVLLGHRVAGIDCNQEAVDLALAKGVHAAAGDFWLLEPGSLAAYDVVYADGFLGHICDDAAGLAQFFRRLRSLAPGPGTSFVFSNDAPLKPGELIEPHPSVRGFCLISCELLAREAALNRFACLERHYYTYNRPISGPRNRTIGVFRSE